MRENWDCDSIGVGRGYGQVSINFDNPVVVLMYELAVKSGQNMTHGCSENNFQFEKHGIGIGWGHAYTDR